MGWQNPSKITSKSFTCGFCGFVVASNSGYFHDKHGHFLVYVCSHCERPTFFERDVQHPGVAPGSDVSSVPADIAALYREARNCVAVGASTASVLLSRKLLAHIAVAQGAKDDLRFVEYVEHLASNGYVPPNGRGWVDHIRKKGNEANHEIVMMTSADAGDLLSFLEMLLKFVYEFPNRIPQPVRKRVPMPSP